MLILEGHEGSVRCVAYSPDGRWLASGGEDQTVHLWDLANGCKMRRHEFGEGVETVAFSPNGRLIAAGTSQGGIKLFPCADAVEETTLDYDSDEAIRCMAFSPDGVYLAAVNWGGQIQLYHLPSRDRSTGWHLGQPKPSALAFVSDSEYLAVGGPSEGISEVVFLPVRKKHGQRQLSMRDESPLQALALSPNGLLLTTGHANGNIHLWEAVTGKRLATLCGHTWTVYSLAFTPDGRTLLSGSADGTVRLWDVATGRERRSYRWHKRWVTCAALSPDGMTAAAGSDDATIVVWDVDE